MPRVSWGPSAPVRHWLVQARRGRRFATRALALADSGPPWHRGFVAMATLTSGVLVGLAGGSVLDVILGGAVGMFLALADTEGPLIRRQAMLLASLGSVLALGLIAIALIGHPALFTIVFGGFVFLAGLGSWAGPPYLQATRFGLLIGLLLNTLQQVRPLAFVFITLVVALVAGITRAVEHLVRPDARQGDFVPPAGILPRLQAAGPVLYRYLVAYNLTGAAAWYAGRFVDQVHPTWVTITALMVMLPDPRQSYQRILQSVFGTLCGAVLATVLLRVLPDPVALSVLALGLAFFLPHFIRRNFWLHSMLVVVFVLVLLDVSSHAGFSRSTVTERINDVALGCALALVGTLIAFGWARAGNKS